MATGAAMMLANRLRGAEVPAGARTLFQEESIRCANCCSKFSSGCLHNRAAFATAGARRAGYNGPDKDD
jgi:hypothetical protein